MKLLRDLRAFGLLAISCCGVLRGQATADVVVVVDTSTSMASMGMDPERTSLLVTKLLADIVPGDLSVVRLLSLSSDSRWLPSRDTGKTLPCSEDKTKTCHHVEPTSDWDKDVRTNRYGAETRVGRGDTTFKSRMDGHLAQVIGNSLFGLAFRAAQGVFDAHRSPGAPRAVIWLSDGTTDDEARLATASRELRQAGVAIEAIVFGSGTTAVAERLGLSARKVRSPAELMNAFAGAFRRIMGAPYELDSLVSANPSFTMKPGVDEAWVVTYGDDTLGEVAFDTPTGQRRADYAQDVLPGAGAYRVLYVVKPTPGRWALHLVGGGPRAAYAVIQRSNLIPVLLEPEPRTVTAGVSVNVVAALAGGPHAPVLSRTDFPDPVQMELSFNGKSISLLDDGTHGDRAARDGKYSGVATFDALGEITVKLRAKTELFDRTTEEKISVTGVFRYRGGPVTVDLGAMRAGAEKCAPMSFTAEHQGVISFTLKPVRVAPPDHRLELRGATGILAAGGEALAISPGSVMRLCLVVGRRAEASEAAGEHWLDLESESSNSQEGRVPIQVRWKVVPLTFWELWGRLIGSLVLLLLLLIWVYGYIRPKRFQRNLALVFVPERSEIEEQSPQPIAQWKGVGIGWYRDARAFLHANYSVSGRSRGALASLHATNAGTRVCPVSGSSLFRETSDGEWEAVAVGGQRVRSGGVIRVGDRGPYFQVLVRQG